MAECEKSVCGCEDIQDALDAYNNAVDSLAGIFDGIGDGIKNKLQDLETRLKDIEYDPAQNTSDEKNCNECGSSGDLKRALDSTIGTTLSGVVRSCCGPGGQPMSSGKDAFPPVPPGEVSPCGQNSRDQVVSSLFPPGCQIFQSNSQANPSKTILISKFKCESVPPEKCQEDKVAISIVPDGEVELTIPILGNDIEMIKKVFDYVQSIKTNLKKVQNLNGADGALQREACLGAVMDRLCNNVISINAVGGKWNAPPQHRLCANAVRRLPPERQGDIGGLCEQIAHIMAYKHSKTYGHVGTINDTIGKDRDWRQTSGFQENDASGENDKPKCGGRGRVHSKAEIFVPLGTSPETITQLCRDKLKAFEEANTGCKDADLTFSQILQSENCGGANPCKCATGDDPDAIAAIERLKESQRQINKNITEKQIEQLNKQNALDAINGRRGVDEKQIEQLTQELKAIKEELDALAANLQQVNLQIDALLGQQPNVVGKCVTFEYYYCPANSTPKKGVGGNQGGGRTNIQETNHSIFYEMVNKLANSAGQSPCGNHNPIQGTIDQCLESRGKEPVNGGIGASDEVTPPMVEDGTPCEENDNVRSTPSRGPCGPEGGLSTGTDRHRRDCVRNLMAASNGLLDAANKAQINQNNVINQLSGIVTSLDAVTSQIAGVQPPPGADCAGWTTEGTVKKINDITKSIDNIKRRIDSFNFE